MLTKTEIHQLIKEKKLTFSPALDEFQIQPHAIDLRLGYIFYLPKTWKITKKGREAINVDPLDYAKTIDNFEKIQITNGQYFELLPKEFVIITTLEKISIKDDTIMGVLYPRSTINRRGLAVDLTGIIDVWFNGPLMVPLINNTETQTIRLYPGERICQVSFQKLSSSVNKDNLEKIDILSKDKKYINDEVRLIRNGQIKSLKYKYQLK